MRPRLGPRPLPSVEMARMLRTDLPDGFFHVGARGVDRVDVYRTDDDRRFWLHLALDNVKRYAWRFHALCEMNNHYHAVVEATREQLSAGFHRLNGVYALCFNERHARTGHLFGDRFWSRVVEGDEHLEAVCRYVVDNPVRAGFCDTAADWPWSASRYGLGAG